MVFEDPLSVPDIVPKLPSLKLFPNPVQDLLLVESTAGWKEFLVLDAQGKVVQSGSYNAVQPGLDVSSLPSGAYILRLLGNVGEKIGAARFVKT